MFGNLFAFLKSRHPAYVSKAGEQGAQQKEFIANSGNFTAYGNRSISSPSNLVPVASSVTGGTVFQDKQTGAQVNLMPIGTSSSGGTIYFNPATKTQITLPSGTSGSNPNSYSGRSGATGIVEPNVGAATGQSTQGIRLGSGPASAINLGAVQTVQQGQNFNLVSQRVGGETNYAIVNKQTGRVVGVPGVESAKGREVRSRLLALSEKTGQLSSGTVYQNAKQAGLSYAGSGFSEDLFAASINDDYIQKSAQTIKLEATPNTTQPTVATQQQPFDMAKAFVVGQKLSQDAAKKLKGPASVNTPNPIKITPEKEYAYYQSFSKGTVGPAIAEYGQRVRTANADIPIVSEVAGSFFDFAAGVATVGERAVTEPARIAKVNYEVATQGKPSAESKVQAQSSFQLYSDLVSPVGFFVNRETQTAKLRQGQDYFSATSESVRPVEDINKQAVTLGVGLLATEFATGGASSRFAKARSVEQVKTIRLLEERGVNPEVARASVLNPRAVPVYEIKPIEFITAQEAKAVQPTQTGTVSYETVKPLGSRVKATASAGFQEVGGSLGPRDTSALKFYDVKATPDAVLFKEIKPANTLGSAAREVTVKTEPLQFEAGPTRQTLGSASSQELYRAKGTGGMANFELSEGDGGIRFGTEAKPRVVDIIEPKQVNVVNEFGFTPDLFKNENAKVIKTVELKPERTYTLEQIPKVEGYQDKFFGKFDRGTFESEGKTVSELYVKRLKQAREYPKSGRTTIEPQTKILSKTQIGDEFLVQAKAKVNGKFYDINARVPAKQTTNAAQRSIVTGEQRTVFEGGAVQTAKVKARIVDVSNRPGINYGKTLNVPKGIEGGSAFAFEETKGGSKGYGFAEVEKSYQVVGADVLELKKTGKVTTRGKVKSGLSYETTGEFTTKEVTSKPKVKNVQGTRFEPPAGKPPKAPSPSLSYQLARLKEAPPAPKPPVQFEVNGVPFSEELSADLFKQNENRAKQINEQTKFAGKYVSGPRGSQLVTDTTTRAKISYEPDYAAIQYPPATGGAQPSGTQPILFGSTRGTPASPQPVRETRGDSFGKGFDYRETTGLKIDFSTGRGSANKQTQRVFSETATRLDRAQAQPQRGRTSQDLFNEQTSTPTQRIQTFTQSAQAYDRGQRSEQTQRQPTASAFSKAQTQPPVTITGGAGGGGAGGFFGGQPRYAKAFKSTQAKTGVRPDLFSVSQTQRRTGFTQYGTPSTKAIKSSALYKRSGGFLAPTQELLSRKKKGKFGF